LRDLPALTSLEFTPGKRNGDAYMKALSSRKQSVLDLHLSRCTLTFPQTLLYNDLEILEFDTNMTSVSLQPFLDCLPYCVSLRKLSICNVKLQPQQMHDICLWLWFSEHNPKLTYLRVNVQQKGFWIEHIANVIKFNKVVRHLSIRLLPKDGKTRPIPKSDQTMIEDELQTNTTLTYLRVSGVEIGMKKLEQNCFSYFRRRSDWMRICVLISFFRSNHGSALIGSGIDLVDLISREVSDTFI